VSIVLVVVVPIIYNIVTRYFYNFKLYKYYYKYLTKNVILK